MIKDDNWDEYSINDINCIVETYSEKFCIMTHKLIVMDLFSRFVMLCVYIIWCVNQLI